MCCLISVHVFLYIILYYLANWMKLIQFVCWGCRAICHRFLLISSASFLSRRLYSLISLIYPAALHFLNLFFTCLQFWFPLGSICSFWWRWLMSAYFHSTRAPHSLQLVSNNILPALFSRNQKSFLELSCVWFIFICLYSGCLDMCCQALLIGERLLHSISFSFSWIEIN